MEIQRPTFQEVRQRKGFLELDRQEFKVGESRTQTAIYLFRQADRTLWCAHYDKTDDLKINGMRQGTVQIDRIKYPELSDRAKSTLRKELLDC